MSQENVEIVRGIYAAGSALDAAGARREPTAGAVRMRGIRDRLSDGV